MDTLDYKESQVEPEDFGEILIEKPFNPTLINIESKSPTVSNLITRLKANPPEIDLYPDFQRKDDLWDKGKQSRLIESILVNFPLPAFYFDGTDDNQWLVVDGLQRLSAIRNFIVDKSLKLEQLQFLIQYNHCGYDDLPRALQRRLEESQIVAYIIKPGTPDDVKYNIFSRINTGGLVLTPQEIRHALNQGIPAKYVAELAALPEFKEVTEHKIATERMLDREFITRFVAFYLTAPNKYSQDLDSFLNHAMKKIGEISDMERQKMKTDFRESMKTAKAIFGAWAFRKADLYPDRKKPMNKALFEVWSVSIAKLNDEERKTLVSKKRELMQRFVALMKNNEKFVRSITSGTGGKSEVIKRFSTIDTLIKEIL